MYVSFILQSSPKMERKKSSAGKVDRGKGSSRSASREGDREKPKGNITPFHHHQATRLSNFFYAKSA